MNFGIMRIYCFVKNSVGMDKSRNWLLLILLNVYVN